ncbi:MAG: isoleucine--tRNA ligase [Pseudomonadota bacterium]
MCAQDTPSAYRDTVFLPETDFPMRAGLPKREPEWLARWEAMDLYGRLRAASAGRERFELHDGPPYANGHLHIGHALNKILKDIVVRSHQMLGYDSRYVPGWDCHGLPIEWEVEAQYRKKGKDKDQVPINDFRAECRAFAQKWVDVQREEFKRFGVLGEWDRPYTTMAHGAEAVIARDFMKFVMNGTLYRGSKPVMWSPVEKTALAEAEVEYHDHDSHTIWVKFPVRGGGSNGVDGASVVIWTTTPWTIPSNKAVAYASRVSYGLYEVTDAAEDNWTTPGDRVVMADGLIEEGFQKGRVAGWKRLRDVPSGELSNLVCQHPLHRVEGGGDFWDYEVPLLEGDFVTDETGTGFVHCAPSHGADDFELFVKNKMLDRLTHNVDADGAFAEHVPLFAGKRILKPNGKEGDANRAVIEALSAEGALLARGKLRHSYPHSWRSGAPLIFRNTPQWFVAVDKPMEDDTPGVDGHEIRELALTSIDQHVEWFPATSRNRIRSMVENRPDWVLSRQRAWGVPLTCFMRKSVDKGVEKVELLRDQVVNDRIVAAFEAEGADAWFRDDAAERFLRPEYDPAEWEKVDDILDVWFDSGSTHAFALAERLDADGEPDGIWPASVYLEGTDQHRGWFQSSLLQAAGTRGRAPYQKVITHGFTLDEDGRKMSKKLGNGVAPQDVIKQYGADILRLWVVQSDFMEDQRIGPEILKNVADSYRRLRNTLRYLLGALKDFDASERVEPKDMPELERLMLHRLAELDPIVREGYQRFEYPKLFQALFSFCTTDLSAFYFDIRKDALYCDAPDSLRRRACRTVMEALFERLSIWLAPMLCFTAEDVWLSRHGAGAGAGTAGDESGVPLDDPRASVHLQTLPETPASWLDPALAARWALLRTARRAVNGALEIERREKRIGSSLEAAPTLHVTDPELRSALDGVSGDDSLADILIVSGVTLSEDPAPDDVFTVADAPGVAVAPTLARGRKCLRCWRISEEVGTLENPDLCARCAAALG